MRERAQPWFRVALVRHAPLHGYRLSQWGLDNSTGSICDPDCAEWMGPGLPTCATCAMAIEQALESGLGKWQESRLFVYDGLAFPSDERLMPEIGTMDLSFNAASYWLWTGLGPKPTLSAIGTMNFVQSATRMPTPLQVSPKTYAALVEMQAELQK